MHFDLKDERSIRLGGVGGGVRAFPTGDAVCVLTTHLPPFSKPHSEFQKHRLIKLEQLSLETAHG